MTLFFRDAHKLVYLDFAILTGCIISCFHHMLTHLFDSEGNCLWKYDVAYADCVDAVSRVFLIALIIWFNNYLSTKVIHLNIYNRYIYIYI